jgi:plasmid stabilization system protein ParE
MTRVARILRRAQSDLFEIRDYLRIDSPAVAGEIVERLLDAIERLERFPLSGPVPRDERLRRAGYRYIRNGRYLVFYRVGRKHVTIHRVLHERREYSRLL